MRQAKQDVASAFEPIREDFVEIHEEFKQLMAEKNLENRSFDYLPKVEMEVPTFNRVKHQSTEDNLKERKK